MGVDIYLHVEWRRREGEWFAFGDGFSLLPRDHDLFERMGWENPKKETHLQRMFEERGLPKDVSKSIKEKTELLVVDKFPNVYVPGTTDSKTAAEWVKMGATHYTSEKHDRVLHPDLVFYSHLSFAEFARAIRLKKASHLRAYSAYIAIYRMMEVLEKDDHETRVVFWFDG